ncbi:MAG TPA: chromate transporter [Anaerovoracaceae bacterium]|nr:chromate transporter [Anaerovoracaceae bacterium]
MVLLNLYVMFFSIGIFGFGGGYAMLPLIFQRVQEFGQMSAQEFSNLVALSQVTPGPVSVNAATYVGYNYAGLLGAVAATLGIATPSFLLVIVVMSFMDKYYKSKGIQGVMNGIRPATVGLIASAAFFIGRTVMVNSQVLPVSTFAGIFEYLNVLPFIIFICTIILIAKYKVNPIIITLVMGIIGAVLCG